ncbi:hypothetical protein TrST_g4701 [Triparma strigata]|uniref:Transcription elongation factor 1 homolog n=1 Tax=Triparma strigata TaxID=1606541 RepID=A0A9W7ABV6_9STRA|nr:hypothetical protein TrST_g4701 [Triparma strigata]
MPFSSTSHNQGRRAKKQKVQTKARPKVATKFKCPFCNHTDSVECKLNNRSGTGSLSCRVCSAGFEMPVHYLTEPIDIFYEWLDACEREERKRREGNVDLLGSALGRRMEEKKNEKSVALGEEDSDTDEEERLLSEGYGGPARSSGKPGAEAGQGEKEKETVEETVEETAEEMVEKTAETETEKTTATENVGEKRSMASLGFDDDSDDSD